MRARTEKVWRAKATQQWLHRFDDSTLATDHEAQRCSARPRVSSGHGRVHRMTATRGSGCRNLARQSRRAGGAVYHHRVRSESSNGAVIAKQNLTNIVGDTNDEEQNVRACCYLACVCHERGAFCYQRLGPRTRAREHCCRVACVDEVAAHRAAHDAGADEANTSASRLRQCRRLCSHGARLLTARASHARSCAGERCARHTHPPPASARVRDLRTAATAIQAWERVGVSVRRTKLRTTVERPSKWRTRAS